MDRTKSIGLTWATAQRMFGSIPTREKLPLTFGDLIHDAYEACGKRRAAGFVRLAVNARLVEFIGAYRFVIAET